MIFRTLAGGLTALGLVFAGAPINAQGMAGPYLAARQASLVSDYSEGSKYFAKAVARDPRNLGLLENALIMSICMGDKAKTGEFSNQHIAAGGDSKFVLMVAQVLEVETGAFAGIMPPKKDASGIDPLLDGLVHAWALIGQGNMSEAITAFGAVAENEDFASFARYHQALALAMVGDFEGSNAIFSGETYGPLTLAARGIEAQAKVLVALDKRDDAVQLLDAALST